MDGGFWSQLWEAYKANREHLAPLLTFIAASIVAWAALRQARTATKRHVEQTNADRQRRITESFSKAVEQLGSDKIQVRLGGIYTLERIARESELDYWPIMETLVGFVRERTRWKGDAAALPQTIVKIYQIETSEPPKPSPPTDIAAVLTVIQRRDEVSREREWSQKRVIDLSSTDLRGAFLGGADLRIADFADAHLEGAILANALLNTTRLARAHLENAYLLGANLYKADLVAAHLEKAYLHEANLNEANCTRANLKGANLSEARLEGAILTNAHLEGADLRGTTGLEKDQLDKAYGDAETKLPKGLTRPAHWRSARDETQ